jgi:hypothetical protein
MTGREAALPDTYPVSDADEFQVAMTKDVKNALYGHLRPDHSNRSPPGSEHQPEDYEQGVIAHITRSSGTSRVTYIVESIMPPENPDDVYIDGGLKFSPAYRSRAKNDIEHDPRRGIAYFHSHPGWSAHPSRQDLNADPKRLQSDAGRLGKDRPYAAGIIASRPRRETGEPEWSFRAYEFDERGPPARTEATAVRVLGMASNQQFRDGPYLKKLATAFSAEGPEGPGLAEGTVAQDSTVELWGDRGQKCLSGIRVAIIGCGGVGSLLAKQVARLGVGGAVFVDFDHLKEANLNRAYGATREDAREHELKAKVVRDTAEKAATASGFEARAIQGSIVESANDDYAALGDVLDCDVILNAADPHWVRKVVDRIAYAHLIPVVTGGTYLAVDEDTDELSSSARSAVATAGPELACLHCLNTWKEGNRSAGVVHDRKHPRDRADNGGLYVTNGGPTSEDGSDELRDPSVVSTNGLVASLMMERFQALVVGTSTSTFAGRQIYRPSTGEIQWMTADDERRVRCKNGCDKTESIGLGDYVDLATGKDMDLRMEVPDAR